MEGELLYRNHFFTDGQIDGQTDRQLWWNQYASTTLLEGVYKRIFNAEKSLKNDPHPWGQNFMGESLVQNLMLKLNPCQLLTLKNDPGSHFYRWKMTQGVIFQRGHFLMLHRKLTLYGIWLTKVNENQWLTKFTFFYLFKTFIE